MTPTPPQARSATSSTGRPRRERAEQPDALHSPLKRVRLEPSVDGALSKASSPPPRPRRLPPLHTLTTTRTAAAAATAAEVPAGGDRAREKLDQLRAMYLADVALVYRELQAALAVCRRPQALLGVVIPRDYLRKLERSVEALQKLFRLLSARPAPRLRGPAHFSLLCAVEAQIQTQVLPVATVVRTFEHTAALREPAVTPSSSCGTQDAAASKSELLSPRSPSAVLPVSSLRASSSSSSSPPSSSSSSSDSGLTAEKAPDAGLSWRYLSMVLSLQL